ncbi:MAG: hypothetical protein A2Y00_07135 [Omnitrophica WOR_2 bacterium GWF2_43_52]|nr:MAG: hypothetical protein A2Y01_07795 [Omnitrophica WOR_2 bacterium GWC2_44_8]OGX20196.1 MAG: hypothetical protein A2Y00_07135 [Omnitrophica WOR_2 bacterium GWF2_43_52]HAH19321.1 hypothetical protein [Candidatus Omnitrophota bacterium]HBG63656.1 hypothetical protein [Candidatus Omnitrophota bacterium]HCD38591.1 hypothetical protein [Candidatus Omnitrophota bacterium]
MKVKFVIIAVLLSVIILLAYCNSFFSSAGFAQYDSDYQVQTLPFLEFAKNNFIAKNSCLWNPLILCGVPHMAEPSRGFFYPPRIFCLSFLSADTASRVFCFLHIFLASLGIVLYLKTITSRLQAAFIGAIVFIFCGPAMEMIVDGDLDSISTIAWLPFLLFFTERYIQNRKRISLFFITLSCSMSLLAGELQLFSYILIFYIMYLYNAIKGLKSDDTWIVTKNVLKNILLGIVMGSVQVLPVIELNALSIRYRSYATSISDALPVSRLIDLVFPYLICFKKKFVDTAFVLNCGVLAFIFSLVAVVKDRKFAPVFMAGAIFLALSAFGAPVHLLYYHFFPLGKYVQAGEELIRVLGVLLSILAGLGWSIMQSSKSKRMNFRFILFVVLIAESAVLNQRYQKQVPRYNDRSYFKEEELMRDIIKNDYQGERVARFKLANYIVSPNILMSYGIADIAGFYSFILKRYADVVSGIEKAIVSGPGGKGVTFEVANFSDGKVLSLPLLNMLNVKYIFTSEYVTAENLELVYDGTAKLYKNLACLPRVFLVHDWRVVKNETDILKSVVRRDFNPLRYVYLEEEPVWHSEGADIAGPYAYSKADMRAYKPDTVVIETRSNERSMLFISDMFYPGWRVCVDGKASPLYRANYSFRAVAVGKGRHIVTFYYSPLGFKVGAILSLFSLFFLLRQVCTNET